MKKTLIGALAALALTPAAAQHDTLDISGNNTSSSYVSYDKYISLPASKTLDVFMARYTYFSPAIGGGGTLNLHAGGERCYLGTAKGASWPNWNTFKGDVNIHPYPENSPAAGFYGVVLAHGGKSFTVEDIEGALKSGKVNTSMANNRVTLHAGATLCCEANTAGAGFRLGELNTAAGSVVQGYMKKNTRAAYFLVGCLDTDATLAGTIAPPDYSDTHPVGLIKEGKGTYRLEGNNNYLSGALRILQGRVLAMNDRHRAQAGKLRGATGGMPADASPVAYVFSQGCLGGTGSIGGTVDNYGTMEPGTADSIGLLTLHNYTNATRRAHLYVRPASVLRFKIESATSHDQLAVDGNVRYFNMDQNFTVSSEMPTVQLLLMPHASVKAGDEFCLLAARGKDTQAGDWHFNLLRPEHHTWALDERPTADGGFALVLRLVSLEDQQGGDDDHHGDDPNDGQHMGPYYDDGIDDATDHTTLKAYATRCGKHVGTALSTWKNDITNENLAETREAGSQFNMLVAENEMKFDALQPAQGQFSFGAADNLASFARRHQMTLRGHCLAWHSQLPQWVSTDGKKNDRHWTRTQALDILKRHITQVVGHFRGQVAEWDVVNECLDDNQTTVRTQPDSYGLRQSVWTLAIGEDYIDSAFVWAHQADPDARLFLNDYGVEMQGKAKALAFRNLAVGLKKRGIPIDGVGLQCHFSVGDVDSTKLENTIRSFGEEGLLCIVTELDMGVPDTTTASLEEQARNYRVITDIVLNNDNCPNLVVWGLKDNDSWRPASTPLLYTASLGKKAAYYAVRSALRHRALGTGSGLHPAQGGPQGHGPQPVYDLQGRRATTPGQLRRGIYVSGGRKFVVR